MPEKIEKQFGWTPSKPDFRDIPFSAPRVVLDNLPLAVDLSQPSLQAPWSPTFDQGNIGSCGPQTSAGDIIFAALRQQGLMSVPKPSRLFIYWCTRFLMGTVNSDSGVDNRTMLKALSRFGWCDETLWEYDISRFRVQPSKECFDQGVKRKVIQYQTVPQNLETMKGCLAGGDPFIFGFSVYSSVDESDRTGMIPMPARADAQVGGHDILIVGYNDGPDESLGIPPRHFKLRNSWGPRWGQGGYGFIPYEYAGNPQLAGDFWTVRHSAYVPEGPPPPPPPPPPVPVPPEPVPVPVPPEPIPVPPQPVPPGGTMTREELRDTLNRIIAVAEFLAKWTPNKVDDQVVEYLKLAVKEDWLLDLILKVINSGGNKLDKDTVEGLLGVKLPA